MRFVRLTMVLRLPQRLLILWRSIGVLLILGIYFWNTIRIIHYEEPHRSIEPSRRFSKSINAADVIIDVISIGSLTKIDFLQSQQGTFGRHVRHFWSITESTEGGDQEHCAQKLTVEQYLSVIEFCTNSSKNASINTTTVGNFLTAKLFRPKYGPIQLASKMETTTKTMSDLPSAQDISPQAIGWLCAQQRPLAGLRQAVQTYGTLNQQQLPHYLLIIDDDTYVNMRNLIPLLRKHYPHDAIHVVAGCVKHNPQKIHFSFPFGGFGTILTKAALQQRLLQPIDCSSSDSYRNFVCWQIQNNQFGERDYFQNQMSVAEMLIHSAQPYTRVSEWRANRRGYCWHSDHVLAYFLNYYHVGRPEIPLVSDATVGNRAYRQLLMQTYNGSNQSNHIMNSFQSLQQCENRGDACDPATSALCHNIPPEQMQSLYASTAPPEGWYRTP